MSAMAATANPPKKKTAKTATKPKYVSWKAFQEEYLSREDEFKYEWTNGIVEKTPRSMNSNQLYIKKNLENFLDQLRSENPALGDFYPEIDFLLTKQIHRRPNLSYLTDVQVNEAITVPVLIPDFVIEIISEIDHANFVMRRIREYFELGIRLVWLIFPLIKEVHVFEDYHGFSILRGDETCSAEKVIPGFVLCINDIFKLP